MTHVAKSVVKVSIGASDGNRVARIIQPGGVIPEGVPQEDIDRLVSRGFIAAVESEVVDYSEFKVDELRAEIERRNADREDTDKVSADGKKDDLVAALVADDAKQAE